MNAGTCKPTVNDKRNQNSLLIMFVQFSIYCDKFLLTQVEIWRQYKYIYQAIKI